MLNQIEKEYCLTCGHIIAKTRTKLSSIEFRRSINNIKDIGELLVSKDQLIHFVASKYNKKDTNTFSEELETLIDNHNPSSDIVYIKLWIFNFISEPEYCEMALYRFLKDNYIEIDEPFAEFYENYQQSEYNFLSKNMVSRSLSALGLKTVMKKITYNSKPKCTIMLTATKDELSELLYKNGI